MKVWEKTQFKSLPLFDRATESAFNEYHEKNPHVYELFKRFTFEKIRQGYKHLGAKAVMERIRWESPIKTDGSEFKVNNNHPAYYARLFMRDFPQHQGLFQLRKSKADEVVGV